MKSKKENLKVVHKKDETISEPIVNEQKNDVQENKAEEIQEDPFKDAKWFDEADLVIKCSCGHTTHINHPGFMNIKTGLQMPFLYTITNPEDVPGIPHKLGISCEKCGHNLTLEFIESEKKDTEKISDAIIVEETKEDK